MGLNLNTSNNNKDTSPLAFDVPSEISVTELKRCAELVPPYTPKPKTVNLSLDLSKNYYFILFDRETTCTGKQAKLCQISAITEDGIKEFSNFILPKSNISNGAIFWTICHPSKPNGHTNIQISTQSTHHSTLNTQSRLSDTDKTHHSTQTSTCQLLSCLFQLQCTRCLQHGTSLNHYINPPLGDAMVAMDVPSLHFP